MFKLFARHDILFFEKYLQVDIAGWINQDVDLGQKLWQRTKQMYTIFFKKHGSFCQYPKFILPQRQYICTILVHGERTHLRCNRSGALPPGQRNMRIAVQKVSRPSYTSRRQTAALNIWLCAALKAVSHVLLISKPWSLIKNQSIPHVHRAI